MGFHLSIDEINYLSRKIMYIKHCMYPDKERFISEINKMVPLKPNGKYDWHKLDESSYLELFQYLDNVEAILYENFIFL